jgi:hypothetical protein
MMNYEPRTLKPATSTVESQNVAAGAISNTVLGNGALNWKGFDDQRFLIASDLVPNTLNCLYFLPLINVISHDALKQP